MIDIDEANANELIALSQFIKHFNVHFNLLVRRYVRFKEIDDINNTDIDVITYLDIIVVQLRAMCIESAKLKQNYTAQILLRKVGEEALAQKIDNMLQEEFIAGVNDFTVRKAIKMLADCFICHYDNFDGSAQDGWAMAEIIEKQLRNPYAKINLDYIMKTLIACIGEGLSIKPNHQDYK